MAMKPRFGFVLEYVSDIDSAKRFYIDVLGLTVEREHPTYVEFRDPAGVAFAIANDESMTGAREPEVYWLVEDAERAIGQLPRGVELSMPVRQMPYGKVFGVKGPSGQTHYLLHFAEDRPSHRVS
jgi:predicted enzyme related to lactoylglutathione lyase